MTRVKINSNDVTNGQQSFKEKSAVNPFFQPKLSINQPNDVYEQEADAMADKVMHMNDNNVQQPTFFSPSITPVQRKCQHCEEEEKKLQRKETNSNEATADASTENYINSLNGKGRSLTPEERNFFEPRIGYDFSNVQLHTNSEANQSAKSINALAYTHSNHVVFGANQYQPNTESGQRLMAHELTHVVQQQHNALSRKIMRQRINNDEIEFDESGSRYRITRITTPVTTTEESPTPPRVRVDMDDTNVFLEVSWCRGSTRGNVRFGANVPQQVQDLFQRVMQQASQGGTPSDIQQTILNTDLSPYISTDIIRSGGWQISGDVHVTVDRTGATGGGGGIHFRRGPVDLNLGGQGGRDGWSVTGGLTITPGQTDESFTCPTQEHVRVHYRRSYRCEQWRQHQEDRTRMVPVTDTDNRYIYFNYANEVIDEARSAGEIAQIQQRLREGYRVQSIHGFTSPEGPMQPGARFRGNDQLSIDRANAALQRLQQIIQQLNADGSSISGVSPDVIPLGNSELYTDITMRNGRLQETEGAPLEQHAEQEFGSHTEEDRHRAAATEQLQHARTWQQRADIIYPLLRRAVIVFTRDRQEQQHYQEAVDSFVPIDCGTVPNYESHISSFRIQDSVR
jgi:hypothetical protein